MEEKRKLATRIFWHEARNSSIMYITFFGLTPLLSTIGTYAPSVLQSPPSSSVAALLFQQHVFQLMINFFIAMENYTQEYPKFSPSLNKVYSLKMLLTLWREIQAKQSLIQDFPDENTNRDDLLLQNVSVNMPTRSEETGFRELLKNASITLTPGQYRLLGASNAGKSTTFKAIMGLWPHASGTIVYPCAKRQIRFIPQETFIPYDPTLLEMITYPARDVSSFNRDEIIHLMRELNLSHLIDTLDQKRDLKMLSRGEQQRLAIISAIVARPKVLLLDESTASIDKKNKAKVEELIQLYLPGTLVIIIDHNPLQDTSLILGESSGEPIQIKHRILPISMPSQMAASSATSSSVVIDIEMAELKQPEQQKLAYRPNYATHFKNAPRDIKINADTKKLEFSVAEKPESKRRKSF